MSFISELRRRNVFRMAALYVVGSWLVLQVADLLADLLDVPDWTLRFVLLLLVVGFPFVLIFSWVYELTPDGLRLERDVERDASVTAATARKLDIVVIVLLSAVLVVLFLDRMTPGDDGATPTRVAAADASVAVLPFADLSPDTDHRYLADGLSEILLHRLAQIPTLKVAARTSSFAVRERERDVRQIGEVLGVAHVLEGSVQRAGDELRISAQLVRTDDGFEVWSGVFDERYADLFQIQDQIAETVATSLVESLLGKGAVAGSAGASSIEAYDLYLQALAEYRRGSFASLSNAEALLGRAVALDPGLAEAIALLARTYLRQINTGARELTAGLSLARDTALRALAIDPDNVDAAVARIEASGRLATARGDLAEGRRLGEAMERVVARFPGEVAPKFSLAGFYQFHGRPEEAVELLRQAIELDPLNAELHLGIGSVLSRNLGRASEAREAYRESLRLEPNQPNVYGAIALLDLRAGDLVGYVQNLEQASVLDPVDPELPGMIAVLLYELGLVEQADQYRSTLRSIAPESDFVSHVELAAAWERGDAERIRQLATEIIENDLEDRQGMFVEAVQRLYRLHHRRDSIDAADAVMSTRWPAWHDPESGSLPLKVLQARFGVSALMFDRESPARRQVEAARMRRMYAMANRDISEYQTPYLLALALEGRVDDVIGHLLNAVFVENRLLTPEDDRRWILNLPLLDEVVRDVEVAAGIAALDRALAQETERVARFLEGRNFPGQPAKTDATARSVTR